MDKPTFFIRSTAQAVCIAMIVLCCLCFSCSQRTGECATGPLPPIEAYHPPDSIDAASCFYFQLDFYFLRPSLDDFTFPIENIQQLVDRLNYAFSHAYVDGDVVHVTPGMQFAVGSTFAIESQLSLDDFKGNHALRDVIIDAEKSAENISIWIVDSKSTLRGFAPIFSTHFDELEYYNLSSIFIYDGLFDRYSNTLIHEIGHLFGLSHPWELSKKSQSDLGLIYPHATYNFMDYGDYQDHFTIEQLGAMFTFAHNYRRYLIQ